MLHRVLVSGRGDEREWGREKENRGEERRGRKEGGERRGIRNEREARGREEGGKRERRGEGRKREGRGQEGDEWGCLGEGRVRFVTCVTCMLFSYLKFVLL